MSISTSAPTSGYYHAQGDPPGTVRFWDGSQWQGGPTSPPASAVGKRTGAGIRLASPGRRIGARMLDYLVWLAIAVLIALLLGVEVGGSLRAEVGAGASVLQNLVWFVAVAALEIALVSTRGASLGKMALDLQVVDAEGNIPTVKQAALRIAPLGLVILGAFGSWAILIVAFISLVLMFADANHHTLWDKLAKTVVVDRPL
ncbi:MAG: RDD family protein [Acidimicrobiales bacterium]|nr:RDD family protein [Acidimicrobiales bacterium]